MGKKVVIYQPGYFQPLHYYARVWNSDVFVLLGSAQLNRKVGQARAKIQSRDKDIVLTVPVKGGNRVLLKDAVPDYEQNWVSKHLKTIEMVYGRAKRFNNVFPVIEKLLHLAEEKSLSLGVLGSSQVIGIIQMLGWKGKAVVENELSRFEDASDWMLDIVKKENGTVYVCGQVAYDKYLDIEKFRESGVEVVAQDWQCPVYKQMSKEFVPNCSILDGLMNCESGELVKVLEGVK